MKTLMTSLLGAAALLIIPMTADAQRPPGPTLKKKAPTTQSTASRDRPTSIRTRKGPRTYVVHPSARSSTPDLTEARSDTSITRPRSNSFTQRSEVGVADQPDASVQMQGASGTKSFDRRMPRPSGGDFTVAVQNDPDLSALIGTSGANPAARQRPRGGDFTAAVQNDPDLSVLNGTPGPNPAARQRPRGGDFTAAVQNDPDLSALNGTSGPNPTPRQRPRGGDFTAAVQNDPDLSALNGPNTIATNQRPRSGSIDSTRATSGDISRERGGGLGAAPSPAPSPGATLGSDLPQNQPAPRRIEDSRERRPD